MNSLNYFKNPPPWTFLLPRYPFHSKSSQSDLLASFHDLMRVFICLNIYSTSYDTVCLNPSIVKSSQARCMKVGWYLRMVGTPSTTVVTRGDSLATQLSDEPWVWRFISSAVRTVLHPLLLLSTFEYSVAPPWDKKWLTLGILEWLPERNWLWELPFSRFP